ncbi:citrate/2-methylcitrate synthase [Ferrovibrio sp.]|uniref:citrate/2-methylcitrate synthase n=1 Tax=Ferrovibrio sp. TaxID=1917215 RepID=UPI003D2C6476
MRYHGTDIDGVSLEPEKLEIRGTSLTDLIGGIDFIGSIPFTLTGERAGVEALAKLDAALAGWLGSIAAEHPAFRLAALAAESGAGMAQAVTAGLMGFDKAAAKQAFAGIDFLPADAAEGLAVTATIPALLAAWRRHKPGTKLAKDWQPPQAGGFVDRALAAVADAPPPSPAARIFFDDALVTWIGGFGYVPPSIMIPRISIGTGVPVYHALAAGFGAAGPMHIGACEQATGMIMAALALPQGTPEQRIKGVIDAVLAKGMRIGGFGHPLFLEDPRPPRLRQRAAELGLAHPALELFEAACAVMLAEHKLKPNVDFATGTAFAMAGIRDPGAAAGIAMMGRTIGMLAHIIERRARPPFGVTSATARKYLDMVPKGWL